MNINKMKVSLYGGAFLAFATLSGAAQACQFIGLKVPKEVAPYLDTFNKTTKDYDTADQAIKTRVDEFLRDDAEVNKLGTEHCDLLISLYKNDIRKEEIFTKWGDPNSKATITSQLDPYVKASKCKQ